MEHPEQLYVMTSGVFERIDKKRPRVDIVNPRLAASASGLAAHSLDGAARDQKLFEHPAVELKQSVVLDIATAPGVRAVDLLLAARCAVSADDDFDNLSDHVIGQWIAPRVLYQLRLSDIVTLAVGEHVAPLVAVGVALVALASAAQ
ncbi:MAG: hypothetical protein K2M54_05260 [Muribaculaceae bacterium]|nr:hypothetical protein [Muribaculaceae bacterium]